MINIQINFRKKREILMTNEQFIEIKNALKDNINKDIVLKELRNIYPCVGCHWNDGKPHSACYNCE